MKCLVCGKEYDGAECPVCRFPNIQIPGNYEEGLLAIQDEIEEYRKQFFSTFYVGIRTWHWIDINGTLKPDYAEDLYFGQIGSLQGEEQWLSRPFARIPDVTMLNITIVIKQAGEIVEKTVTVENLSEMQLLEIGAVVDDQYNVQIIVRNGSGTVRRSEWTALIG